MTSSRLIQVFTYVLGLLIIITSVTPLLLQSPIAPASTDSNIRVMSYNIQQAFNTEGILDYELLTETIREANPDIIGLQESLPTRFVSGNVNPLEKFATDLGYYIYTGPGPQYQTPGVSILSKFPIIEVNFQMLRAENLPRTVVHGKLSVFSRDLDFYSIHLGVFSDLDRQNQVEDLHEFVESTKNSETTPRVIVGDFNDHPNTTIYNSVISQGYIDSWIASGNTLNATEGFTYHAYDPYETIDYIFLTPDISVVNSSFVVMQENYGSDHLPIYVDLTLP